MLIMLNTIRTVLNFTAVVPNLQMALPEKSDLLQGCINLKDFDKTPCPC